MRWSRSGWRRTTAFLHGLSGLAGPDGERRASGRGSARISRSQAFRGHYAARRDALAANGIPLKPGAAEALRFVAGRGLPLALATSAHREPALAHLRRLEVLAHFDVLVTREDVARAKPYPDLFLAAAERLGVAAADCLAVEDSPTGVQAALAAGMMTVMVPDVAPPTEELRARCVAVHASLLDLPGLFVRRLG